VKIGINSLPEELMNLEKIMRQLEVEKEALKQEKETKKTTERIEEIKKELAEHNEKYTTSMQKWKADRSLLTRGKEIKEEIQQLQHEADIAQKQTDYARQAELLHGEIPKLTQELEDVEKEIKTTKNNGHISLKDSVQEDDIAGVISIRTGIPVSKLVQTEADKLAKLEEHLQRRVIGQDEAV